ncbi:MAG TPA: N-formylglutamate amidohydrolase [bacterium]|nr:N-formylglutamate amidohydrolase [bacterium]
MHPPVHHIPGVLARHDPDTDAVPVVFDSPHSGAEYPADFGHAVELHALRAAEDMYVDELFGAAPRHGAALLRALFPRSYIDVNRNPVDLDPATLEGEWPGDVRPSGKTRVGKGLIRTRAQGVPIYDRRLGVDEVQARLERYYHPYHDALHDLIATTRAQHGTVWHINCHSWTPPETGRDGRPVNHVDMCLGNRDGTTCGAAFTDYVAELLRKMGYEVRVNRPFRGMEVIKRHGRPDEGQHSLQIEINRNLYMHPRGLHKLEGFAVLQGNLNRLIAAVCDYAREAQAQAVPEPTPRVP